MTASAKVEGLSPGAKYHFRIVANSVGGKKEGPDTTFRTYGLPQVFAPCANKAFRTEPPQPSAALPDCRAYEQASPVQKNGLDSEGRVSLVKASPQGDRVSFLASGGMPGIEGAQDIPTMLASRGAGNWSTPNR